MKKNFWEQKNVWTLKFSATFDNEITAFDLLGITIVPKVENVSANVEADVKLVIYHDDFQSNTTYTVYVPYGAVTEYNSFGFSWTFTTGNYTDESIINEDEWLERKWWLLSLSKYAKKHKFPQIEN